jgi:hypothetical protein
VTWNELVAEQVTVRARLSGETENVVPDAGVRVGVIGPSIGSVALPCMRPRARRADRLDLDIVRQRQRRRPRRHDYRALVVDSVVGNCV